MDKHLQLGRSYILTHSKNLKDKPENGLKHLDIGVDDKSQKQARKQIISILQKTVLIADYKPLALQTNLSNVNTPHKISAFPSTPVYNRQNPNSPKSSDSSIKEETSFRPWILRKPIYDPPKKFELYPASRPISQPIHNYLTAMYTRYPTWVKMIEATSLPLDKIPNTHELFSEAVRAGLPWLVKILFEYGALEFQMSNLSREFLPRKEYKKKCKQTELTTQDIGRKNCVAYLRHHIQNGHVYTEYKFGQFWFHYCNPFTQ